MPHTGWRWSEPTATKRTRDNGRVRCGSLGGASTRLVIENPWVRIPPAACEVRARSSEYSHGERAIRPSGPSPTWRMTNGASSRPGESLCQRDSENRPCSVDTGTVGSIMVERERLLVSSSTADGPARFPIRPSSPSSRSGPGRANVLLQAQPQEHSRDGDHPQEEPGDDEEGRRGHGHSIACPRRPSTTPRATRKPRPMTSRILAIRFMLVRGQPPIQPGKAGVSDTRSLRSAPLGATLHEPLGFRWTADHPP